MWNFYRKEEKGKMKSCKISLHSIDDVKNFVNLVAKCDYDVDITSGRYIVDAKSIMGIFSLDLKKPITVEIHSEDCEDLLNALKEFSE